MSLLRSKERPSSGEATSTQDLRTEQRDARRTVEESEARRAEAQRTTRRAEDIEDATIKSELEAEPDPLRSDGQMPPPTPDNPQQLAALFGARAAQEFREQWDATQIGFVDNPRQAVQRADELVTEVMKSLAQSFSDERARLEAQFSGEQASTEHLRVALQRYRSFFQRLLSL
jgi:hypothetical protein